MKEPFETRIEFLWKQHEYISDFIKFADAKAGFIATIATAILGAMYSAHSSSNLTASLHSHEFGNHGAVVAKISTAFFVASILTAAWSIKPRLFTGRTARQISWVDIANYKSAEDFEKEQREQDAHSLARSLSLQVYKMAIVCKRKHRLVAWSLIFAFIGAALVFLEFLIS